MTTKISTSNIQDTALTTLLGPKIASIVYPGTETATDTNGGETINLTGTAFQSGCNVLVNGQSAGTVTFISSTQISFTAPAASAGTYVIYVINPDGGTAISIPGISYSGTPNWSTTAGSLGSVYETASFNSTLTATGDAPISYSLFSGTLPTGASLNSSTGLISGTSSATASSTTYNFTIQAKDAQNQTTNRAFSLTVNPDVVTWVSPTNNATYNVFTNTAIANVTMSATSAAGKTITYSANSLPTGLSITGSNIAGTPTVVGSTSTLLTATSATTNKTATTTINWVVSVAADTYWKYNTLLLSADSTTQTTPFNTDVSTNNSLLVLNGDIKSTLFGPYQNGYYSNYFNGTSISAGSSLSGTLGSAIGNSNFTLEGWVYHTTLYNYIDWFSITRGTTGFNVGTDSSGIAVMYFNSARQITSASGVMLTNVWQHFAFVRNGTTITLYINGSSVGSTTTTTNSNFTATSFYIGSLDNTQEYFPGYLSNLRLVIGTALYTTTFTPSTTPLTAITNTVLLTCQSNRFLDNSTNNTSITLTSSPQISNAIPFAPGSSYSTYGSTYFDGNGDYLTIPGTTNLFSFAGSFTIEFWAYFTSNGTGNIFSMNLISGGPAVYITTVRMLIQSSYATTDLLNVAGLSDVVNQWAHFAIVRSGTTLVLYRNGVQVGTTTWSTDYSATSGTLRIGYDSLNSPSGYFTGYMSDLRIVNSAVYASAFTPTTTLLTAVANTKLLTSQYNGAGNNYNIIDNSTFNNVITRYGNTNSGTFSPYGDNFSVYFNGTSDYLTLASNTAFDQNVAFTIECWVYRNGNSVGSGYFYAELLSGYLVLAFNNSGNFIVDKSYIATVITSTNTFAYYTWHHVTLCYDGTTTRLFINGTLQGSTSGGGVASAATLSIGVYLTGTNYFNGHISNLRVVRGTALYTSAFTPSTTPLTAITNTSLLTCQSYRFVDNSPNNLSFTVSGSPQVQKYSPFSTITVPKYYSTYFNGSTDYLTTVNNTAFSLGSGDFTIELWIYLNGTTQGGLVERRSTGYGAGDWVFYANETAGTISFYSYEFNNSSTTPMLTAASVVTTSAWYHVAVVRIGTTFTLYVNGVSKNTVTSSITIADNSLGITIGRDNNSTGRFYLSGLISNVRIIKGTGIYTSGFTPSTSPLTTTSQGATAGQVSLLTCQNSTFIDNSTNNFTITAATTTVKPLPVSPFTPTISTTPVAYSPTTFGGSYYFNGTTSYLTTSAAANAVFGTNSFTVECWFYTTATISAQYLIDSRSGALWAIGWGLATVTHLEWYTGSGTPISYVPTSWPLYTWYHVAFVRNGTSLSLYLNGVNVASATDSTNYTGTPSFTVGSRYTTPTAGNYFSGYISDLRIVNGTALYTSNFVPTYSPLTNIAYINNSTTQANTVYPVLLLNGTNIGITDSTRDVNLETLGNAMVTKTKTPYSGSGLSYYFDGTGDWMHIAPSNNFEFGGGDFTVEFWYYTSSTSRQWFIHTATDWWFGIDYNSVNTNKLGLWASSNGTSWNLINSDAGGNGICATTLPQNQWNHIAATRNGNVWRVFLNGTQDLSVTVSGSIVNRASEIKVIGSWAASTHAYPLNGYLSDFRITKGYARYTSNFTSPTSSFLLK